MKVRLKVETPIRVGGREQQINKLEYVRSGSHLFTVNPRKLAALLISKSERTITDWTNTVLTQGQYADLTSFLKNEGLFTNEAVRDIARYSVNCGQGRMNEFLPHARDARNRLLVPGTAIKGAIRSAVMWALVSEDEANGYVKHTRERKDKFAQRLVQDTLQSYRLPQASGTVAHRDLLRAVKVSDAYGELESWVEKITIQSYSEYRGQRTTTLGASNTIFVECLTPGSSVDFDMKVDKTILENFKQRNEDIPFNDEASLLDLVRNFYSEVWGFEQKYYGVAKREEEITEILSEPPSLEEWVTQKYGQMPKKQYRKYRGEYKETFDLFETEDPLAGRKPEKVHASSGVEDGEIKVGKVREFYSSEKSPGFRLGWGSGLMSTTVDMRLEEEHIGKVLNIISSRHHREVRRMDGPKSRKLAGSDRMPESPMGWASLEVV